MPFPHQPLFTEAGLPTATDEITILIPVFNEWDVVSLLLSQLVQAMAPTRFGIHLVLVDDGSARAHEHELVVPANAILRSVRVLVLAKNLGHQRAIAIGLAWLAANQPRNTTIVMDGDGEDDPADIPRLLAASEQHLAWQVVFAARTRRSESLRFQVCYRTYQLVHHILTGVPVRFGNFSAITPRALQRLSVTGEIWNHYAAATIHARIPHGAIGTTRAKRLGGKSTMNFVTLVVHGMSALSVFAPLIGVRALVALGLGGLVLLLALGVAGALLWNQPVANTGVAVLVLGLGAGIVFQQAAVVFGLILLLLANRTGTAFLPIRDYRYFIERIVQVR